MSTTIEVSIRCGCGSALSFREEPVNGRARWPVTCTNCGADATEIANAFIARKQQSVTRLRQTPPGHFTWLRRRKDAHDLPPEPGLAAATGADSGTPSRAVAWKKSGNGSIVGSLAAPARAASPDSTSPL